MNLRDLTRALSERFDPNDSWDAPEDNEGYYGQEVGGVSGFYHQLAGTHEPIDVEGIGRFTKVEYDTPYNEMGDIDAVLVFKYEPKVEQPTLFEGNGVVYYRTTGDLDSWQGGYFNEHLVEVKPVEVTKIEWVKA